MKVRILKAIALMLVIACLSLTLVSCGAPELEEVRDNFIALIEASAPINDIFFGAGLPVYDREGEEGVIYETLGKGYDAYGIVRPESGYLTADAIKAAAEAVYSRDYLDDIYTMAFDGYADPATGLLSTARYLEEGGMLLRLTRKTSDGEDNFDFLRGKKRAYLYDTMEIVRPSNASYVNLSIDSRLDGSDEILNITLRFVNEDGEWRLDAPTY